MTPRSYVPREYFPTSPRSGNDGGKVFRMQNMILRGTDAEPYAEVYSGSLNLGEDIATSNCTGTVTTTTTSTTINGAGTLFKTELHLGQQLEIFSGATRIPVRVDEIISDTVFTACRLPEFAVAGATCVRFPVMFPLAKKRGSQIWGSGSEADLGTIVDVGDGTLRRNGSVLPGVSLVATRAPKIAIFNATTGNYAVWPLGMATPTITAAAVAGTGKNMPAGLYSVRAVAARQATLGYNNPSPKVEVTLTAGQRIQVTTPSIVATSAVDGQDAWMFFVTLYSPSLTGAGVQGPWYRYELPTTYVRVGAGAGEIPVGGGTYNIEYNDAEIDGNDILSFNNDPPPHAEFTTRVSGFQVYISCQGPGATSPGPFVAVSKINNIEAAPASLYVSTSPPDPIVGFYTGLQGRMYLLCINSLQIIVQTQAQDPRIPPIAIRPFWSSGFKNPESLIAAGDILLGMTSNGLAKSLAEGDIGQEEFNFAVAMTELLKNVNPGHCLLKLDPKNNAIVLMHSGDTLNSFGFWTTRCWMYGLRENKWIGDVVLTSETGDMIVSSAATINGQLEFLAGGRQAAGTTVVRTYRWDTEVGPGVVIPWYMAWQFSDFGFEDRTKAVKALRFIGCITGGTLTDGLCIHGAEPGEVIDIPFLETSGVGKSGNILPTNFAEVAEAVINELDVDNLSQLTVRVAGTWDGIQPKDRLDEIVLDVITRGAKR